MRKLIQFVFMPALILLIISENTFSQKYFSKQTSKTPQKFDKEFIYSGIVSWQGLGYGKNDLPEAILFRLEEHQGLNFRIALYNAESFGVTTEHRTRIFIGSKVEFNCREGKKEGLELYHVTSFNWIAKKIVQEGKLHYSGIIEKLYMKNYGDRGVQLFLKLSEQPNFEFWLEAKMFENSVANWLGVLDEEGRVKISDGDSVSLTCDKTENMNVLRVTSLGCFETLETYQVSGIIQDIHSGSFGLPVSEKGRKVILFIVKQEEGKKTYYAIIGEDGKIINPSNISDDNGRFVIDVPSSFVKKYKEFTVGTDFIELSAAQYNGELLTFTFDDQKKIDLGKIKLR